MQKVVWLPAILWTVVLVNTQCCGQAQRYPPSDLKWYAKALYRELETAKEQLKKLTDDKGFDPEARRLLKESSSVICAIEAKLEELQTKKMTSSLVLLDMSIIKERRGVLRDNLVALGTLVPHGPTNFPEHCVVYKLDIPQKDQELAKNEGLEMKTGKIEQKRDSKTLVLSTPDATNPNQLVNYQLDDKVGLIGSADPNAISMAKQSTPAKMNVIAWVDIETNKVMCISQPTATQ